MPTSWTVVVTGANRGVGRGIVELLANTQCQSSLTIYATSRSGTNLDIESINGNQIRYATLDITDPSSISKFISDATRNGNAIDVLINNAAYCDSSRPDSETASQTFEVNYYGTTQMCELFLTQGGMAKNKGSRIVNVTATQLKRFAPSIDGKVHSAKNTFELDELAVSYLTATQAGSAAKEQAGWGADARGYVVSKLLVNAMTTILAKEYPEIMINCCCPGWCDTDMGGQAGRKGPKSAQEGARAAVRCAIGDLGQSGDGDGGLGKALLSEDVVSGKFVANGSIIEKGWGKVRDGADIYMPFS